VIAAATALSACGGGSQPSTSASADEVLDEWLDDGNPPTRAQAAAFLAQAGFGGNMADVDEVVQLGFKGWLEKQINMPMGTGHIEWMIQKGVADTHGGMWRPAMWNAFVAYPDQLRQRVVYALSQIFVVSVRGFTTLQSHYEIAGYLDVLTRHALGNFRDLLEAVTLNPAMGQYLNMRGNQKAAGVRIPDENYAREIMQLFTIGLEKLNPDGTKVLDSEGNYVPAYGEEDVQGLAAVFTGWDWTQASDPTARLTKRAYIRCTPMVHYPERHSTTEKRFLGVTIPAGTQGPESLSIALDTLFNHPNTGPFIALRLIQRLVTSNPTPAYVRRVARVFDDNGNSVRGDMAAVVSAVLLGREARGQSVQPMEHRGKLREPVLRFLQFCRVFSVVSRGTNWNHGSTESDTQLGQMPMSAPSVFNFYTYNFKPLNTGVSQAGLVAPELNLAHEPNVVGYLNFMNSVISSGTDFQPNIDQYQSVAADAPALVSQLDMLFTGNTLSTNTLDTIIQAVGSMPSNGASGGLYEKRARIRAAAFLIMASPEYLVQKT
jgi:uncharacterized protein (DUF1800 family)